MKKRVILALACLMLLTGCKNDGRQIDATYNTEQYKDYFTEEYAIENYNYLTNTQEMALSIFANLFDGLIETDRFGNLKNCMSENIGSPNGDYTVWDFTLRDGCHWYDMNNQDTGYEVTANDFVTSAKYILDHEDSPYRQILLRTLKNAKDYVDGKVDFSDVGVKAVSAYNLRYTLTSQMPYFNSYLLNGAFLPVSKALLDKVGNDFGNSPENLWYNGPYYISSASESQITIKGNYYNWDAAEISFKEGTFTLVEDDQEALKLFEDGKLSYAYVDEDYALEHGKTINAHMYMSPFSPESRVFVFNFDSTSEDFKVAVQNDNFRMALRNGLNLDAVFNVLTVQDEDNENEQESSVVSTITPSGFTTTTNGTDYLNLGNLANISHVKALNQVDAAANASEVMSALVDQVTFPINIRVALPEEYQRLGDQLQAATALLDPNFVTFETIYYTEDRKVEEGSEIIPLIQLRFSKDYDLLLTNVDAENQDPSTYLENFTTAGEINAAYMHVKTEMYDAFIESASRVLDQDQRLAAFAESEYYLLTKAYVIPFTSGDYRYKVSSINDYSYPAGTYGLSRYKLKGIKALEKCITINERADFKKAYDELKKGSK